MKTVYSLGLILFILFSCSRNENKKAENIDVTIMQTLENTQTFPMMENLNQYLLRKKNIAIPVDTFQNNVNDTNLSLTERLKRESTHRNPYAEFEYNNPLFSKLNPMISIEYNDNQKLKYSPYLGIARIEDTGMVSSFFRDDSVIKIFPPTTRFFWNGTQDGFLHLSLAAVTENCKKVSSDSRNVEYIAFKKNDVSGLFEDMTSKSNYQLYIKLKNDWAANVERLTNKKTALLLSVMINNIQYSSPITQETAMKPILLASALPEEELNRLKKILGDLMRELN